MNKLYVILISIIVLACTLGLKPTQEYTTVTKQEAVTSSVTNRDVWIPESGKSIVLMGIVVSGNSSGQVSFDASRAIVAPFITASDPVVIGNGTPIYQGKADEVIRFTNTGTGPISDITLFGWEER